MMVPIRKKLIEVALPLEAINAASAREKSIRHGHPSTLHLWWARRPLAAARAVIFAQMVDDPSANPDLFPTEKAQQKERQRLFKIIEDLVQWENTTNVEVLNRAREEIWQSWRRTCAENADHPRAKELFDRNVLPAFHDPFAGGGALPLEAQRLGLVSYASDLNPVAVLINKAMIEIPPKFAGCPPINPESRKNPSLLTTKWKGAQGLAEDVRYYGKWMRDEAERRIGHLYPKIEVTAEMAKERKDLKPYVGQKLTVIAWLWARTVKSPNPAFANLDVPLVSTFMLSTRSGKEAYVQPVVADRAYGFVVKIGKPPKLDDAASGTKLGRGASFRCLLSGATITGDYIKAEGRSGRLGLKLLAFVVGTERGRTYLSPQFGNEEAAFEAEPEWRPDGEVPSRLTGGTCVPYGLATWFNLFTNRQLVALTTLSALVEEVIQKAALDAATTGVFDQDPRTLAEDGRGARSYADSIGVYLGLGVSRTANTINSLAIWSQSREQSVNLFRRQAIPMTWDFPEATPFGDAAGDFGATTASMAKTIADFPVGGAGHAEQQDAQRQSRSSAKVVSTDPPYYDNVAYADLSDFFYVWARHSLRKVIPTLFSTVAVPKAEELIAVAYRHGSKEKAESFFLNGMTSAMNRISSQSHPAFPITIYYAFKQSENTDDSGTISSGWEIFLEGILKAGLGISGTWPMRTERPTGVKVATNALASSIVLVCRKRSAEAPSATRRDFIVALKNELPIALADLQRGNIAPVDLAQAAIGPGMAVFTRYSQVLDADGKPMTVGEGLSIINQTLDEVLSAQEGDFDPDSRWALAWFEQHGFSEGEFGVADVLARAKNTSVQGMVNAGVAASKRGKVRLLKADELPEGWDPETDTRLSAWEKVHHLIRALESNGEAGAAVLMKKLGARAEVARELAYRLYSISERKKRATEALAYNGLVQSWLEIARLAQEAPHSSASVKKGLFDDN
jgi:putative DNA methylase